MLVSGPGISTIEMYVCALKKCMIKYNKIILSKFPGRAEIRLTDFLEFRSSSHVIPMSAETLVEDERSYSLVCVMIQAHIAFLKLLRKEATQETTSYTRFLPRDEINPDLPKQDLTAEDKEKACEAMHRFGLSLKCLIVNSKEPLTRARKKADAMTKKLKRDQVVFLGKTLPNPQEVIMKFLDSQYVK